MIPSSYLPPHAEDTALEAPASRAVVFAPAVAKDLRWTDLQGGLVVHHGRVALDDQVETLSEGVAPGRDDAVRVLREVVRLAFGAAGGEVQRAIHPDGHHRRHMRSPVRTHGREPVHLGFLEPPARLEPRCRGRTIAAERLVQLRRRLFFSHVVIPFAEAL